MSSQSGGPPPTPPRLAESGQPVMRPRPVAPPEMRMSAVPVMAKALGTEQGEAAGAAPGRVRISAGSHRLWPSGATLKVCWVWGQVTVTLPALNVPKLWLTAVLSTQKEPLPPTGVIVAVPAGPRQRKVTVARRPPGLREAGLQPGPTGARAEPPMTASPAEFMDMTAIGSPPPEHFSRK